MTFITVLIQSSAFTGNSALLWSPHYVFHVSNTQATIKHLSIYFVTNLIYTKGETQQFLLFLSPQQSLPRDAVRNGKCIIHTQSLCSSTRLVYSKTACFGPHTHFVFMHKWACLELKSSPERNRKRSWGSFTRAKIEGEMFGDFIVQYSVLEELVGLSFPGTWKQPVTSFHGQIGMIVERF